MKITSYLFPILVLVPSVFVSGEELDQHTNREIVAATTSDSARELDGWVEMQLANSIKVYKESHGPGCDRGRFLEILRLSFDTRLSPIYTATNSNAKIKKAVVPKEVSIYRQVPATEIAITSPMVRIGSHVVGIDKLDHFFGHGYSYWRLYGLEQNLDKALQLGENQELGSFGLGIAGVKSYGDLAANYAGLLFWKSLLDGDSPFVTCENNQWTRTPRNFKFKNYVDASWDEGINCNSYASEAFLGSVLRALKATTHPCPVDMDACKELTAKYKDVPGVLHPRCRSLSREKDLVEAPIERGLRVKIAFMFDLLTEEGVTNLSQRLGSRPKNGTYQPSGESAK